MEAHIDDVVHHYLGGGSRVAGSVRPLGGCDQTSGGTHVHARELRPHLDAAAKEDAADGAGLEQVHVRPSGLSPVECRGVLNFGDLEQDEAVLEVALAVQVGNDLVGLIAAAMVDEPEREGGDCEGQRRRRLATDTQATHQRGDSGNASLETKQARVQLWARGRGCRLGEVVSHAGREDRAGDELQQPRDAEAAVALDLSASDGDSIHDEDAPGN